MTCLKGRHCKTGEITDTTRKTAVIGMIIIISIFLAMLIQHVYAKYIITKNISEVLNFLRIELNESDITIDPKEIADKVNVTITTNRTKCFIQYKIGEDGTWTDYKRQF